MTSPFASFANATLTFQRATGPAAIDALGSAIAPTEDFVVSAYIRAAKSTAKNQMPWEGGQDNVVPVEGRCVDPIALPPDIVPGVKAIAVIAGISGEFILEASLPSALGVDDFLGGKIKGRFITRSLMGETL